jgi:hypothetical protein
MDPEPDPSIFIIDLKDPNTFTSFFKGEKSKRSHKPADIDVFLTIFA